MATISTPGVGSGLDVRSIVTQLVNLEKIPLNQLQTKASSLQTKLSAYGRIKSELAGLQDAAAALMNDSTWQSKTFSSNNTNAITGSSSSTALSTSFAVQVNSLAQSQSVRSAPQATGSAIGAAGRLDIQAGQWTGNAFGPGAAPAVSVNIAATDTLTDIATKINSAAAGVTAVVVRSGAEDRLMLRGNGTGNAAGFRVQTFNGSNAAITDGTTGVGKLAYDYGGSAFYGMTATQQAQNAAITIDGIAVSSATNTVADAVPGITLNLLAPTTTAAQVTVGADKAAAKTKIEAFQAAYNKMAASLAELTRYDAGAKKGAALQGDSTAVGLQNVLKSMLGAVGPAAATNRRLSDIGLELQRDGTLATNATKLDAALGDMANMKTFFETDSGNATTNGLARRIRDFAKTANSLDGSIENRNKALKSSIDRNTREQDTVSERITRTEARLYAQYSRLDANMASLSSLSSFVSQQVAQWSK